MSAGVVASTRFGVHVVPADESAGPPLRCLPAPASSPEFAHTVPTVCARLLGPRALLQAGISVPPSVAITYKNGPSRKSKYMRTFVDDEVRAAVLHLRRVVHARALAPGRVGAGLSPTPIAGLRRKRASRVDARGFLLNRKWLSLSVWSV